MSYGNRTQPDSRESGDEATCDAVEASAKRNESGCTRREQDRLDTSSSKIDLKVFRVSAGLQQWVMM